MLPSYRQLFYIDGTGSPGKVIVFNERCCDESVTTTPSAPNGFNLRNLCLRRWGPICDQRAFDRLINELEAGIEQGDLTLTYLQGLTANQRRLQLCHRVLCIAVRTGITHTRLMRWIVELSDDDAKAKVQVRTQNSPLITDLNQHLSRLQICSM